MDLIIIRHAIAQDPRAGLPDARRALTARGRRRMERGVAGMQRLGLRFDAVLHSPWRRAAQTAALLAPLQVDDEARRECAALARAPSPELLSELRDEASGGNEEREESEEREGSEGSEGSEGRSDELRGELRGDAGRACIAVVGHEPWTGELAAWLVLGSPRDASAYALRKGGLAWLRGQPEPGGMRLVAWLAPSALRRLGRE